ncbi:MAG: hypothetical protein R2880_10520 [Deinococcales bacterium]
MFGHVALNEDANVLVVGHDGVGRENVYVYEQTLGGTNNWGWLNILLFSERKASLSISGNTFVVGTSNGDTYVYTRTTNWVLEQRIAPETSADANLFGWESAIDATYLSHNWC